MFITQQEYAARPVLSTKFAFANNGFIGSVFWMIAPPDWLPAKSGPGGCGTGVHRQSHREPLGYGEPNTAGSEKG